MDRDQIAIIGIFLVVLILASLVVFYVGDMDYGDATFRARPGTEREQARPFTADRDTPPREDALPRRPPLREAERLRAEQKEEEEDRLDPSEQIIAQALSIVEANAAERMVQQILRTMPRLPANPELYTALGYLHLQRGPDYHDAAMTAFTDALEAAEDAQEKHHAALEAVRALADAGHHEEALTMAAAVLGEDMPLDAERLQLHVVTAHIHTELDDAEAAETAYRSALDAVDAHAGPLGAELEKAYRQACLRFARWFREQGRDEDAEAVAESMNARLR